MLIEKEREAFEAWARPRWRHREDFDQRIHAASGVYNNFEVQHAWEAWQARAAHPAEPPRPSDDDLWDQTLRERDNYHEWADKLAAAISRFIGLDIGEHSSANNPWARAIDMVPAGTLTEALARHAEPPRTVTGDGAGELPEPEAMGEAFRAWTPYSGAPDPWVVWQAAWRAYERAAVAQALKGRGAEAKCATCGQSDVGQYGEHPCSTCGLPQTWGSPPAAEPGAAALTEGDHLIRLSDALAAVPGGSWCDPQHVADALREIPAAVASAAALTDAARDVLAERRRQVEAEGWTPEHDNGEPSAALAQAAGCYLLFADAYPNAGQPPPIWPWDRRWWKPKDYRRDLVRAAALTLAEIERFDRAASKP